MATYSDLYDEFGMDQFSKSEDMRGAIAGLQKRVAERKRRWGQLRNRGKNIRRNKKRTRTSTPRGAPSTEILRLEPGEAGA